jgi:hypothetical protein
MRAQIGPDRGILDCERGGSHATLWIALAQHTPIRLGADQGGLL